MHGLDGCGAMTDRYTNDPTRNANARTTHDPTSPQGGAGPTISFVMQEGEDYA